jgi:hypothetical protein
MWPPPHHPEEDLENNPNKEQKTFPSVRGCGLPHLQGPKAMKHYMVLELTHVAYFSLSSPYRFGLPQYLENHKNLVLTVSFGLLILRVVGA